MSAENLTEGLESQIRRNPFDLKCHVERIQYYLKKRDENGCFSAIVDLFIILGPRGFELRKRLAIRSATLLDTDLQGFLEKHLQNGISATDSLPCVTSSILTESISGTTQVVEATTDPKPSQQ